MIPIWTFVAAYVATTIYRMTGGNLFKTLRIGAIVATCVGVSLWFSGGDITTDDPAGPTLLNGSLQYLPALIALWLFAVLTIVRRHPARQLVAAAAASFSLSLVFRTIDLTTCAATGIGTHFMWHLLNGAMVLALLIAMIRYVPPVRQTNR